VIVGTAVATIPASLLMHRIGRRAGFILGTAIGAVAGVVGAYAITVASFWLFAAATFMFGLFAGFGQLYRFAAADAADLDYKAKAISLVLAGGVISAFLGPELAKLGKDLPWLRQFVGPYLILSGLAVLSAIVLAFLDIPPLTRAERMDPGRPLIAIMTQPVFIVATLTAMIAQGVMNFLMTATPIAMHHVHHAFADTALVIEWHVFGMFAPGFFTGSLIRRFGELPIIALGLGLEFACIGVGLAGVGVFDFWLGMLLLGVGWNFAFTGATTLITSAYTPSERGKTQGAVNFAIYGLVSVLSLSSGATVHYFGWTWINLGAVPMLFVAVGVVIWYAMKMRGENAVPERKS
jgi:MFS family permease